MCGMTDPVEAIARALLAAVLLALLPLEAIATTYYVRQTVGDDAHDGTSPATAWQHAAKLSRRSRRAPEGLSGWSRRSG